MTASPDENFQVEKPSIIDSEVCDSATYIRAICEALQSHVRQSVNAVILGRSLAKTESVQWKIGYDIKLRATECFGILHPKVQPLHDRALLRWFIVNFHKSKLSSSKIRSALLDENFWKTTVDNMLICPWLATEVFLLYSLWDLQSARRKKSAQISSRHFQAPRVFDDHEKIDLVTQLFSDDHSVRHNIGVQVTTVPHGNMNHAIKEYEFSKIHRDPKPKQDRFTPQSGCFLIINDAIGKVNSYQHFQEPIKKKGTRFEETPIRATPYTKAFRAWASRGYEAEGPIKHLPKNLHDDYRMVAEAYEHAFEMYRKLLFKRILPQRNSIVEFPIWKVKYHCNYNEKKRTYTLSYFKVISKRNHENSVQLSKVGDFLASFTFYPPENKHSKWTKGARK